MTVIPASTIRRFTEEDRGIYRDQKGRYYARTPKTIHRSSQREVDALDVIFVGLMHWTLLLLFAAGLVSMIYSAIISL